jgi:hypothetical protein
VLENRIGQFRKPFSAGLWDILHSRPCRRGFLQEKYDEFHAVVPIRQTLYFPLPEY